MPYERPQERAERKSWHPVVWQEETTPKLEAEQSQQQKKINLVEKPHLRIVNNVRRFLKESESNPELRQKMIEEMMLCLPSASKSTF